MIEHLASPVEEIYLPILKEKGVRLLIKRDDLIHPVIEGNKFRKLKYNLEEIISRGIKSVTTFGGAFSNHLLAASQAGKLFGCETNAFVNSNYADPENSTLKVCRDNGMKLTFLDRQTYKSTIINLKSDNSTYLLPEGGSNDLAIIGCREIIDELSVQIPEVTHFVLPFGTGGTLSGILSARNNNLQIIAVPVLKLNVFEHLKNNFPEINTSDLIAWDEYHFGGYAKINNELVDFIINWHADTGIIIDPIYNGKALFGLMDKVKNDYFEKGATIIYLHTGGSQGIVGINYRFNLKLPQK